MPFRINKRVSRRSVLASREQVKKSMRKPAKLAVLLSVPLLTACESTQEIKAGTVSQVCRTWLPISVSRKDTLTPQTAAEIAGNNEAAKVWCGPRPVQKLETPSRVAAKS
jgi:hypothetical protein